MDVTVVPVEYTGLTCHNCGGTFDAVNTGGEPGICGKCFDLVLGFAYGGRVTGRNIFGNVVVDRRQRVSLDEIKNIMEVPEITPSIPGSVKQPTPRARRHRKRRNADRRNGSNRGHEGEGK